MRTVLHILTRPADEFVDRILEEQRRLPEVQLVTIDLTGGEPDYRRLLAAVFEADSVATW